MSSQQKPIVIVVHGSWHRPLHYASLLTSLRASGYTVRVPALPTTAPGGENVQKGMADDVDAIRSAMKAYLDAGSEIIVVCHSMGGIAGTDAVVGETVPERRDRGEAGGVRAVVYIASFAPPASGQNLPTMLGLTEQPDWWSPSTSQDDAVDRAVLLLTNMFSSRGRPCRLGTKGIRNVVLGDR
jgi:pimeloyl-ACP methyl ester carboxylesterase